MIIKLLPPAKNMRNDLFDARLDPPFRTRKWVPPEKRTILVPKVGPLQVVHMISQYSDFGDPKMEPKRYLILGPAFQAFARTRFKQSGSTS